MSTALRRWVGRFGFGLGWARNAGLVMFHGERIAVHLFVQPSHRKWLHSVEEYDSCLDYYGLGPFLLVAVIPKHQAYEWPTTPAFGPRW